MTTTTGTQLEAILKRIGEFEVEDIDMQYFDPTEGILYPDLKPRRVNQSPKIGFRLPARLNSPLMETGPCVANYINQGFPTTFTGLEQNTLNYLNKMGSIITSLNSLNQIWPESYQSNMECFLSSMNLVSNEVRIIKGSELDSLHHVSKDYARQLIDLDLRQSTMRSDLFSENVSEEVPTPVMITLITRVRAILTRSIEKAKTSGYEYQDTALGIEIKLTKDGWAEVSDRSNYRQWIIILADRWSALYFRNLNYWNIVPMTYMDYYFTKVEILYNMNIVASISDYSDIKGVIGVLNYLATLNGKHDDVVDFMKSYEGLINMTADFKADSRCSVGSILDVYQVMEEKDRQITGASITVAQYLTISLTANQDLIYSLKDEVQFSILYKIACAVSLLSPGRMLEISSLHKFCFYAVIDELKGVKKLAKRTHTPREVDFEAVKLMRCYFNREYIITFTARHKRLPPVLNTEELLGSSDVVKALPRTETADISRKYSTLVVEYKKTGKLSKDTNPLDWWYNLRPYDCEEDLTVGTPIEHAKDKRSSKIAGTYTNFDTEKELEAIIRSESIQFRSLINIIKDDDVAQSIRIIQQGSESYYDCLTTILKEKEREQKKEGRLFGMLTTEGKQSLSRMMTKAEHVLSYFHGNLMTPQDSDRKKTLHWMAQSLLDDDKYAIMADIEGHNQSMQHSNSGDLLESIGLIYGETGWNKLAKLFSNLNLFYAQAFEDNSFLSKGQLGGIEGWFNPVWTMHTVIVTSLLPELTNIDVSHKAIYSDDIAIVTTIPDLTNQTLNTTLQTTQAHFYRFGMILKALQTVVSKFRITMLRQHYISGVRSDASLKRMISASTMGNQFFHCDEIEASGLVSAISSSLELSNSVRPQVHLKWIRLTQLIIRPFLSSILTEISPEIMNLDNFNEGSVSIYKSLFTYSRSDDYSWVYNRLVRNLQSADPQSVRDWITYQRRSMSVKALSSSQSENAKYQILRLCREDKSFFPLFVLRCLLPVNMGGVNAMLLEQMVLTGFRDSLSRTLCILKNLFDDGTKEFRIVTIALKNVLGGNGRFESGEIEYDGEYQPYATNVGNGMAETFSVSYDESSLATQEWPTSLRQITPEDMIKGKLLALFKKICVNKELKELLKFDEYRSEYRRSLVNELRPRFYSKIARFFVDTSGFMIVDKILGKVENTSSMIRRVNKFETMCRLMAECAIRGPRKWLLRPIYNYGDIGIETNMQEYLFSRRGLMFPMVRFVPCIEPEANSVIKVVSNEELSLNDKDWSIQCTSTSGVTNIDGKPRYLPPLYGNEALYKGSLKDEKEMFTSIKEALLVKCVSVTKWIIYRSNEAEYFKNITLSTNISNCADLALATLGYSRFRVYQPHVPLLTRSEIAHRIPVLDQKPKAVLRCLPSETTKYKATFNQSWIYNFSLADSDIHFDYFKMRIICAEAISTSLQEPIHWSRHYKIKLNPLIRDVQFDYLIVKAEIKLSDRPKVVKEAREITSFTRIRWLTEALPSIINGSSISSMPKITIEDDRVTPELSLTKQLIIEYYRSIKSQYLWDYNPLWSDVAWGPFIKKYKGSLNKELELTPENIQLIIMEHTAESLLKLQSEIAPSNKSNVVRSILERLKAELLHDDEEVIDTCDRIISIMARISQSAKDPFQRLLRAEEVMNMYGNQVNRLLHELFLRIIVENCVSVTVMNGEVLIDKFASISIVEHMLVDMVVFLGPDSNKAILAGLILKNTRIEDLRRIAMQIIEDAQLIVNNGDVVFSIEDESITKVKFEHVEMIDPGTIEQADALQGRCFNIADATPSEILNISKMIEYRAMHVMSRGDPIVYDSPMNSDIYRTGVSILTHLIKINVIRQDHVVLDMIAGRGEYNIALNQLKVEHYSVSRRDQYSAIRASNDVLYIDDYDWAGDTPPDEYYSIMSTLINRQTVLLMDMSHIGNHNDKYIDRLLDVLHEHATFILRYKPLSRSLLKLINHHSLSDYRFYVLLIGDKGRQCPHAYLMGVQGPIKGTGLSDVSELLPLARRVIKDIRSVFIFSSSKFPSEEIRSCSLYEDFDLSNCSLARIDELADVIINKGNVKVNSELLNHRTELVHFYIPEMLIKHLSEPNRESLVDGFIDEISSLDQLLAYGYTEYVISREDWTKCRERPKGIIVELYKLGKPLIGLLRQKHPVRYMRHIAHLVFRSDIPLGIGSLEEVLTKLEAGSRVGNLNLSHWNSRSRNFFETCLLMFGNAIHNDSQSHIEVLRINYQLKLINRRKYHDLLKSTNMMSGLQSYFDDYMNGWQAGVTESSAIMEEYYDQFIRKILYHKEYTSVYRSEGDGSKLRREHKNEIDEKLAKLFLESMDDVMDIDIIGNSIISTGDSIAVTEDDLISIDKVDEIMSAGITGMLGDILSEFRISEEVLREDEEREEKVRANTARRVDEDEADYDKRVKMIALMSSMNDEEDDYEEDYDEWDD